MLKVLMIAAELSPLAKAGGLADVLAALPPALAALGVDVRVLLPRYRGVPLEPPVEPLSLALGPEAVACGLGRAPVPPRGWAADVLDCPACYDRDGLYGDAAGDYPDNLSRFALLNLAALELARRWRPHVVHAHDWHSGLLPLYLKVRGGEVPALAGIRSVFTIHNLAYQGQFPKDGLHTLGLPECAELEAWGQLNWMQAGILAADRVTTVSASYAREIQTPEAGCGLHGALQSRADALSGIGHGVDPSVWDPATDPHLPRNYDWDRLEGKAANKAALQARFGLPAEPGRPLVGTVARLVEQKGFDLIAEGLEPMLDWGAQFVLLGSGDPRLEARFRELAAQHPDRVGVEIGHDEALAHLLEAGSDLFLMPSRFEPAGLNQLYSLRYGTVPVVRATGGLDDTIRDVADAPDGNGFKFADYTAPAMLGAVRRALDLYAQPEAWRALQRRIMREDHAWSAAARRYLDLYRELTGETGNRNPDPGSSILP